MFERIKKLYYRWRTKRFKNNFQLTDRGQYILKYMIDKYVNLQDIDTIADYEAVLEKEVIKKFSNDAYKAFFPGDNNNEQLHIFTALCYITCILYSLNKKQEFDVLNWIDADKVDAFILLQKLIKKRYDF